MSNSLGQKDAQVKLEMDHSINEALSRTETNIEAVIVFNLGTRPKALLQTNRLPTFYHRRQDAESMRLLEGITCFGAMMNHAQSQENNCKRSGITITWSNFGPLRWQP